MRRARSETGSRSRSSGCRSTSPTLPRLLRVHSATAAFKETNRPAGTEAVLGTLGLLPDSLRGVAARAVASPRVYNLTVSNVPGPPVPLYMLGAELLEAHPVVPIAEGHALAVGIFTYLEQLHFGLYADPDAFPQVSELPRGLDVSLGLLLHPREPRRTRGRSRDRPLVASS